MSTLKNQLRNISLQDQVDEYQEMSDGSKLTLVTPKGATEFELPVIVRDWRMMFVEQKDVISVSADGTFWMDPGMWVNIITKGTVDSSTKPVL